jgi:nitrate/nitrite-specific signal transduction histidine kinase
LLDQTLRADRIDYRLVDRLTYEPDGIAAMIDYRIAQEAITNVRKHASATHVDVTVEADATGVQLTITDDGSGFQQVRPSVPGHIGPDLDAGTGRAGRRPVRLRSTPAAGTTVEVRLPVGTPVAFRRRAR